MLQIIDSLNELPFAALMEIYAEGNAKNGRERYPNLPASQQRLEAEQDFYAYLDLFFRQSDSHYFLWVIDGIYVSALRIEPYSDGYLIAALETMPSRRNLGYGKALLAEAVLWIEKHNSFPVYSHISKGNAVSIAVHKAVGFTEYLPYCRYADGSVSHNGITFKHIKKTL